MQQLKLKNKPPFMLDGISAARRGKVLDYKAEKDTHLEQYFFNMQMRQQMIKMKQDKMSQRNLGPKQSKSFEQTIHQQKQIKAQIQPSSPQHQNTSKISHTQKVPKVSRSLSKEHFVTFLDSLITTVQNVQQLVITYFPPEQIDNQIAKQQDELTKISQATEQLSKQLRANSLPNKKEAEHIKTQKNFSKLPSIQKGDVNLNTNKSERGRDKKVKVHNSANQNISNASKTLEKSNHIQLEETNQHNYIFEQYESVQDNINKKTISDKPIDQVQTQRDPDQQQQKLLKIRSGQTTQLPSVRSSQQKPVYQYRKYHKEIQLVLTRPKQNLNDNSIDSYSQSPEQFKNKSVGARNNLQKSQSKNLQKLDIKKINSFNISKIESQKSKKNLNIQDDSTKKPIIPSIQIKITDIDQQTNEESFKNEKQANTAKELDQNVSNNKGLILIDQNQDKNQVSDQNDIGDKTKLFGTAHFNCLEEDERKESIGKMTESKEISRSNLQDENSQQQINIEKKNQENTFITMIQNQVVENDLKLLKQQQTNYNTLNENDIENGSEVLIKVAESIDPQSEQDIVNPLEDSDDQQKQNQGNLYITTFEQNNQEYQNESFDQDQ